MLERRQFHRVGFTARSELKHHEDIYRGHLDNISLNGALVRFDEGIIVPRGGEYILTVDLEEEEAPLQLTSEVVCATCALAGLKFVYYGPETETRLYRLLERVSTEPGKLRGELEIIRQHFADYLLSH
jgi:hypothetical protein